MNKSGWASALVAALIGAPALAQTAVLDEVIVTTTRTDSLRIDNPGNIATLDPSESVNLFPAELVNRAPGVHIHRGSGQEHLTAIRSPVLVGGAGAGSFLYLEDGISMRAPGFANVNALIDAHPQNGGTVEVVRGPGSALYGSNALHGLINFISPPLDNADRQMHIAYGSYGRHALGLSAALHHGDFTSRITLDVNGDKDGYRDQQNFAQQKARLETAWQDGATGYRFSLATMNLNQETAGYARTADCGNGAVEAYKVESCAKSNPNPEAYRDATAHRAYLRMTRRLDDGAQLTLTPYWRSNEMQFLLHFLPGQALEENGHDSIGAQLAYARDTGKVSYIAGIDIELTQGELREVQSRAASGFNARNYLIGTHYDFEVDAHVIAPYVHAVWALGATTDLTTGARFEMTDYSYTNNTATGLHGKLYRPASQDNDFSDISPKIGLVHRLADNRRVFANLARAARAPQVTDLYRLRDDDRAGPLAPPNPGDFDSETLDSLELGYRAVYPGASYEVTAFVMQKKNYHFRDGDDRYETDGETEHRGIELSLSWSPARDWALSSNISYAKHEYAFDRAIADGNPNQLEQITDGNTIDGAPETLANTTLSYKVNERLTTALAWEHVGAYFLDAANSEEYEGHDIFALSASHTLRGGSALALRVDNLFDEAYAKRADKWFGNNRYFPGEGRRFMVRLTRAF